MDKLAPGHGIKSRADWFDYVAGQPAKPVPVNLAGAAGLVLSGPALLCGAWMVNTSTTAGRISFFDSVDGSGVEVSRFTISASALSSPSIPSRGILLEIGCWVSVSAGTASGTVYLVPLWAYPFTPAGE